MWSRLILVFITFMVLLLAACDADYSQTRIPERPQINDEFLKNSIEAIDLVIERSPSNDKAYFKKSQILFDLGNYRSATLNLEKAIEIRPDYPAYFFMLAQLQLEEGAIEEGLTNVLKASGMGYEDNDLDYITAELYLRNQEFNKALRHNLRSLRAKNGIENYFQSGEIYIALEDTANAITQWKHAHELDTVNFTFTDRLSQIYLDMAADDPVYADSALVFIDRNLKNHPDNLSVRYKKGDWYDLKGDWRKAMGQFHEIIRVDSTAARSMIRLSELHFEHYRYDSAQFYAEKALTIRESLPDAMVMQGKVLTRRSRFQEAKEIFRAILANDSTHIGARQALRELEGRINYLNRIQREREESQQIESLKLKELKP